MRNYCGVRVGNLTVIDSTAQRKNGYTVWRCRCDCGNEVLLDTRYIQRGTIRDCGCMKRVKPGTLDLTGMRFGKLTAIEPTDKRDPDGNVMWLCKCDCGKEIITSLGQLRRGYRKSCGCVSHPPLKDYVGKQFEYLTVKEYAGKWGGLQHWRCICQCGNEVVVTQSNLQTGHTASCGCIRRWSSNRYLVSSDVPILT